MALPVLSKDDVHIWTIDLNRCNADVSFLMRSEISRANGFVDLHKRQRFIKARAALRKVLSCYIGKACAFHDFNYGPSGKPSLSYKAGINFNLSYSQNIAMIAVSMSRDVGIDIQAVQQVIDPESVSELIYSPSEIAHLLSLKSVERKMAFSEIWVRKEAYVKALGVGLARPLDTFSVSSIPNDNDALCEDKINHIATKEWRLTYIRAPYGYTAAMAAKGRDWHCIEIEGALDFIYDGDHS
jgi:4'-phosphopantetheinyl transferase